MSFPEIISTLGTIVVATGAATSFFVWLLKTSIENKLKTEADINLAKVESALARVERFEADLANSRSDSYGVIWQLTGSLNLFGPENSINLTELSESLKNWYFEHGWVISSESKARYFLVQEVVSFATTKSISLRRPPAEKLYCSPERTIKILRKLREDFHKIPALEKGGGYSIEDVGKFVSNWKNQILHTKELDALEEKSWVLLQFVLSSFRSAVVDELDYRRKLSPIEAKQETK